MRGWEYKKGGLLLPVIANCYSFHFETILFHIKFIYIRIILCLYIYKAISFLVEMETET